MNYNDKIMSQQTMILNTEQNQFYGNQSINESDQNNKQFIRSKQPKQYFKNIVSNKGKENQTHNINVNNNKNILTNHSFNGFFNQNTNNKAYKKNNIKQSVQSQNFDPSELFKQKSQLQININSPTNFNSSGKLSNLQFVVVNDSINKSQQMISMNQQVMNFMKKYFPINFQTGNYYGQYVTIQDFVEILLEDFQHLLGQNTFNLVEDFADKVFGIFGEKVYFQDLIEKASGNGLTGIVFQILKAIQQDKKPKKQLIVKQNKSLLKSNNPSQLIKQSRLQKSKQGPILFNNMFKSKQTSNINPQPLIMDRSNPTKISLDKFFGNSNISKVQFYQQSTCGFQQQNIQQIKQILQDYIQNMYEDAELKLNKKFVQQMKKISIKYKDTQKILQKINQKVSNYYDCLQLQKDFQKKFKLMVEKQTENQRKIKTLEYELKVSREETQKQKLNTFKTNQELEKIKQKMEKYENAIFQKAMKNSTTTSQISNLNNSNTNSRIGIASKDIITTTNEYPSYNQTTNSIISQKPIQNPPKFQIRVDTFTEHRTDLSPHRAGLSPIKTNIPTYTSYFTKQSLSPINVKRPVNQGERGGSVSPIKQRISFVKTQNPTTQSKSSSPAHNKETNNYKPLQNNLPQTYTNMPQTPHSVYYQSYQPSSINSANNMTPSTYYQQIQTKNSINSDNSRLRLSNVQKIEVGHPIQLRPLSPIGKLGQTNKVYNNNPNFNQFTDPQSQQQRGYSPIRVQFHNSRVN